MTTHVSVNIKETPWRYFNKFDLLWLVVTVLVFLGLVKLGLWQNTRALEKEQRLIQMTQLKSQKPISLAQVVTLSKNHNINDYPLLLKGSFTADIIFLLDNQVNKGLLGYRVLQVFESENHAVLINLGWVQGSINREELPQLTPLQGKHQFLGHVRIPELGIQLMEQSFTQSQWPLRVQQLEIDKFSELINKPLVPFVVYLNEEESIGYEKNWQPIVMPPEKHRGYAFQWFSLAIAWLILMLWARFGKKSKQKG